MYFPSYEQLLKSGGQTRASVEAAKKVTVPLKLFEFLMQVALTSADFDVEHYLAMNPDIRDAMKKGSEISPHQHYISYGYFEGRKGGLPKVDDAWYLRTYPDVAAAVKSGGVRSATEHFEIMGAGEGRAPSQELSDVAVKWKALLAKV